MAARGNPGGIHCLCGHLSKRRWQEWGLCQIKIISGLELLGTGPKAQQGPVRAWINPRKRGQLLPCQSFPIPGTPRGLLGHLGSQKLSGIFNSHKISSALPSCSAGFGCGWLLKAAVKWELGKRFSPPEGHSHLAKGTCLGILG